MMGMDCLGGCFSRKWRCMHYQGDRDKYGRLPNTGGDSNPTGKARKKRCPRLTPVAILALHNVTAPAKSSRGVKGPDNARMRFFLFPFRIE